jgi:hypothetical protein
VLLAALHGHLKTLKWYRSVHAPGCMPRACTNYAQLYQPYSIPINPTEPISSTSKLYTNPTTRPY